MLAQSNRTSSLRVAFETLLIVIFAAVTASAQFAAGLQEAWSDFRDPGGRFSLSVPPGWTYQADLSTDEFFVFYGPGEYDLFYLEILQPASPRATAMDQARAAAEHYSASGALANYTLLQAPSPGQLAGKEAGFMVYAYDDSLGARIVEGRAFVIHTDQAYSLAFADVAERFEASVSTFNRVMEALEIHDPAPLTTAGSGLGFGALTSTQTASTAQAGAFGSPVEQQPATALPSVYTSPDGRFEFAQPDGWKLWEEQSTARGDYLEPWHSLFNWTNKPMTKALFIWDYFDEWEQVSAQYEVVLGVIDDVPGSLNQALETLKSQIAGNLNHIYTIESERVRIGSQTGLEVRIVTRPGMVEPWSEGPQWFKEYTFYTFKQGNALFVWAAPTEAVKLPAVRAALESFHWSGR